MSKQSFSDGLTPGQIQQVLDDVLPNWKEHKPNDKGWINIEHKSFDSDLSINVRNGIWTDQYGRGISKLSGSTDSSSGDIVQLVERLKSLSNEKSIKCIKDVCGIDQGKSPPDVPEGYHFANDRFEKKSCDFYRMPAEIQKSKIEGNDKIVWGAIYKRCNDKKMSWASLATIADDSGLSRRTVVKRIKSLVGLGLLIQKARPGANNPSLKFPLIAPKKEINRRKEELNNGSEDPS